MAESPREQAVAALVTALEAMTGTRHWGGTYPAPVVVERCYRLPETVNHGYWLGVFRSPGSSRQEKAFVGHHLDRFRVRIVGYVTPVRGDVGVATGVERLHRDVILSITASQTLGLLVREVEWNEEDVDDNALQIPTIASFVQDATLVIDDVIPVE